jgi:3-hydroxyacyl-CoA dehydrogenase
MAETGYRGLVIGNDAPNFSAGANLGLVYMQALEQEFDELNLMIAQFQNAMMRMRYSSIPVVGAPHGLALGGGCEINLHCDRVVAAAETYMGLVEFGVGLIPAGGGTKEMTLRTAAKYEEGEPELNLIRNTYMTISTAKVSTSAAEAFDLGFMRPGRRKRGEQQPGDCRRQSCGPRPRRGRLHPTRAENQHQGARPRRLGHV